MPTPVGFYNSDLLIADVKRRAAVPISQNTFTNEDILSFANSELKIGIAPSILSVHEEYYVYLDTVALEANKSKYGIPYRAMGSKLRDLFYMDTNGNLVEMSRILPDDKSIYQNTSSGNSYIFYYIEGNSVVITPEVNDTPTGSLVFSYYIRPNDLVESNRVATITAINTSGINTLYTVDQIPTGFATTSPFDLLQYKPGHKIRKYDIEASAINTLTKVLTFATVDIDDDTEIGDNICFAGECYIPQCPSELHPVLAQRVAARILEAQGDTQGLTNANTKLQEMEKNTQILIDNRTDGSPVKIFSSRGFLRSSRFRRRGW